MVCIAWPSTTRVTLGIDNGGPGSCTSFPPPIAERSTGPGIHAQLLICEPHPVVRRASPIERLDGR